MSLDADQMQRSIDSHEAAGNADAANAKQLSLRERGLLVMAACRSAAAIYRSRLAAGLPADQPDPWPESTWEFLKTQARKSQAETSTP